MTLLWKGKSYVSVGGFKCRRVYGIGIMRYKRNRDDKRFGRWTFWAQDDPFEVFSLWPLTFWWYNFPDRKYISDNWKR